MSIAYIGTVDVFEPTTSLVDEALKMFICQWLTRLNDLVKICFHKFLIEITVVLESQWVCLCAYGSWLMIVSYISLKLL